MTRISIFSPISWSVSRSKTAGFLNSIFAKDIVGPMASRSPRKNSAITGKTSQTMPNYPRLDRRRFFASVTSCQISRSSTMRRFALLGPTHIGIFCSRSRIACRFLFTGYRIICGSSILDTTTKRPLRPRRKKTAYRVEPAFITGIKLDVNSSHRDVLRNRILSGATVVEISSGWQNALANPNSPPSELAPTRQIQYQWPNCRQFAETAGRAGAAPNTAAARNCCSYWIVGRRGRYGQTALRFSMNAQNSR